MRENLRKNNKVKMSNITTRQTCRVSGGPLLDVFDLGHQPLSSFPQKTDPDPEKYPLTLCLNTESGLVQLRHTIDPDIMYSQYWYKSGINQSMRDALKDIVDEATKRNTLDSGDVVVDIACNDGTLLSNYSNDYVKVCIDPSDICPKANLTENDYHINTYFTSKAYTACLGDKQAKIVTSICVFYDLDDPTSFAEGVKDILAEDGLWIMEMSYLPTMLERNGFEAICHEHLEFYSLQSVEYILSKVDMAVEDIEFNEVNGGSFRLYIRHKGKENITQAVIDTKKREKELRLDHIDTYTEFAKGVEQNKNEMITFLQDQKSAGKLVLGYGASTKGNLIMSYYGIGPDLVSHVADRNPMKFGLETVTRIPIVSEDEARDMKPDYFLAFAYHFMPEFLEREKEFLARGGKFISPNPSLTIIEDLKV